MAKKDYYDVLGVARNATKDELKSAFRTKAKEFHPDRNKDDAGAEQKFKAIGEAYDVLKDEQKRAAYDQFGHAAFEGGSGGGGFTIGLSGTTFLMDNQFDGGEGGEGAQILRIEEDGSFSVAVTHAEIEAATGESSVDFDNSGRKIDLEDGVR